MVKFAIGNREYNIVWGDVFPHSFSLQNEVSPHYVNWVMGMQGYTRKDLGFTPRRA